MTQTRARWDICIRRLIAYLEDGVPALSVTALTYSKGANHASLP